MPAENTTSAEPNNSHSPSGDDAYMRLHVTPLDPELLKVIVSSALLPKARNISYHTIETFPEKRYGFLDLPKEDAEKLRKKLNGSVLKGIKIRIERARPSGIPAPLGEAAMAKEKKSKHDVEGVVPSADKSKKRKRDPEVLSGIVLKDGRKVKRGWTTAEEPGEKKSKKDKDRKGKGKEKKKQAKSKYTDHPECLVKTVLPANAVAVSADASSPKKKDKKKGKKTREVVIHEFEKTTKFPTFLKTAGPTSSQKGPLEFVEGKGWVDEDGNVVDAVKPRPPPPERILLSGTPKEEEAYDSDLHDDTDDSSSSKSSSSDEEEPSSPVAQSISGSQDAGIPHSNHTPTPSSPTDHEKTPTKSNGPPKNLSISIPPTTPNEPKVVHPLEALYKRPKPADGESPAPAPADQPFSFFGDGGIDDEDDGEGVDDQAPGITEPMTPFTRKDLEVRRIRSAAPTPDTARPDRRFVPWERGSDIEEEDEGVEEDHPMEDQPLAHGGAATQGEENNEKPVSDFQKWFWEHRGDLNRAWKKRRKLAGKEKRYRENKARMARAI